ncbi:hypothetical protein B2J96_18945 [Mycobacterium shigaense]|nr:hypothetical protein B2J96_18945 [Mycobacterium shigaense]
MWPTLNPCLARSLSSAFPACRPSTALLSKDSAKPANLKATTMLAWEQALTAVRSRRGKRFASAR